MKTCRRYRKQLACLALDGVPRDFDARPADERATRVHLQRCAACREYLAEVSRVAGQFVGAAEHLSPAPELSERFHQRVLRALRTSDAAGRRKLSFRAFWLSWRVALPAATLLTLLAVSFVIQVPPRRGAVAPMPGQSSAVGRTPASPTASEYLLAAHLSLDQLDDLLTRQARQNLPPAPPLTLAELLGGD